MTTEVHIRNWGSNIVPTIFKGEALIFIIIFFFGCSTLVSPDSIFLMSFVHIASRFEFY